MKKRTWPQSLPPDLRFRLERALSFRNPGAADVWGELREWLVEHGVEPPAELLEEKRRGAVREGH